MTTHGHRPHHHSVWSWPGCKHRNVTYEKLREILLSTPSSEKAEEWSRYYTSGPHLAGKNISQVGGIAFLTYEILVWLTVKTGYLD